VQRPQYPQGWSGGTSAAAPLLAAAIARLNADRLGATPKKQPLGYLNPTLYGLTPGAFADIRTGMNDLWNVGCCSSGTGYDATTGLGTPLFGQTAWSSIP
jgi:subtilase family serine protease